MDTDNKKWITKHLMALSKNVLQQAEILIEELEDENAIEKRHFSMAQARTFRKRYVIRLLGENILDERDAELVLASCGLLAGYDEIASLEKRRKKYEDAVTGIGCSSSDEAVKEASRRSYQKEKKIYKEMLEVLDNKIDRETGRLNFADTVIAELLDEFGGTIPEELPLPEPQFTREAIMRKNALLKNSEFPLNNLMMQNEQFVGRDEFLKTIADKFFNEKQYMQILSGMPGVGKTQLALEYAYKNALEYRLIWWINAENQLTLLESCRIFLQCQGISKSDYVAQEFCHFFEQYNSQWLLIYDNAEFLTREQSQLLSKYMPKKQSVGHILITTRNNVKFCGVSPIHVNVFTPEDAFCFIKKAVGSENSDGATDLAKRLGYLPLPLSYAVAYIDQTPACGCREYLKLLSDRGVDLFNDSDDIQLDDYKWTVRETFMISIGKFTEQAQNGDEFMKGVEQFIYASAYLPAHSMDLKFIATTCTNFTPEIKKIMENDALRDKLARVLTTCSLYYVASSSSLDSVYGGPILGMHRLLQEVIATCGYFPYTRDNILSHLPATSLDTDILGTGNESFRVISVTCTVNDGASYSDDKAQKNYTMVYPYIMENIIPEEVEQGALFKLTMTIFQNCIALSLYEPEGGMLASNIANNLQWVLYTNTAAKYDMEYNKARNESFSEEAWLKTGRTKDELNTYLDFYDILSSKLIRQYFSYWRIVVEFLIPSLGNMAGIKPFRDYSLDTTENIINIVTIVLFLSTVPLYPDSYEFSQNWVSARIKAAESRAGSKFFDESLDNIENSMNYSTSVPTTQKRTYYGASLEDMRTRMSRAHKIFETLICQTNDIKVDK